MISSTSNSNVAFPSVAAALSTTLLVVAGIALIRPAPHYAHEPAWYWQMKVEWHQAAPVVLAGDSRVYRGLDPDAFAGRLGTRCLNFGFSSAGFSTQYLDAIESVVDGRQPRPVVVLGITPWSLTPQATKNNGFTDAVAKARATHLSALQQRQWEQLTQRLNPLEVERLWQGETQAAKFGQRAKADAYRQDFRLNGWVASDYHPRNPERGLEIAGIGHADGNRVSEAVLKNVLDRIRQWRQRGWLVLAYRPPTTPAAARLTDQLSGYDEPQIARALQQAGAIWVPLDENGFESYDGSHLTDSSAHRLSQLLADAVVAPR